MFEAISYKEDFPIDITIGNIIDYPIHYHQDTELVMVLKGSVDLKNGYCTYTLKEGDIFTNASHEVHSIKSTGADNLVAVVHISTKFFSQYYPNLSRACYRTYSNHPFTRRHDVLRQQLLSIINKYLLQSQNYKTECIYMMVDEISYLEKYFNLFAFENNMVIDFEGANQITTDRISRIISYIYEFHSYNITLNDLAKREYLSTFYISHIIKNYTGMSFRNFLCFARVEWSLIDLLETNNKISKIAHDVGFSTTAYYEKYFEKWFGARPEAYRKENMPFVLSDLNPPTVAKISNQNITQTLRLMLNNLDSNQSESYRINTLKFSPDINPEDDSLGEFNYKLDLTVTLEDYKVLGYNLFVFLTELNPDSLTILKGKSDKNFDIKNFSDKIKENVTNINKIKLTEKDNKKNISSYGFDSIAYPIYTLNKLFKNNNNKVSVRLRDSGDIRTVIKGYPALVTSCGIKKPIYFTYQMLSNIKGQIISSHKRYFAVRTDITPMPCFFVAVYNLNDDIDKLCTRNSSADSVKNTLNDFRDEIEVYMNIHLKPGKYSVLDYSFSKENSIFHHMLSLNFDKDPLLCSRPDMVFFYPEFSSYIKDVKSSFDFVSNIKGAGFKLALISPKEITHG